MSTMRITALTALDAVPADDDVFVFEDVSDGSTKKITAAHVRAGLVSNAGLSAEAAAREAHESAANPHSDSASLEALAAVAASFPSAGEADPQSPGEATPGTATAYAREDHVHDLPADGTEEAAGLLRIATLSQAVAGTDASRAMTAAATRQAVLSWARDNAGRFPGCVPPSLNLFCGDATDDTAPTGTFTRSTTGTRLGQGGLIASVAAGDVRREWGTDGALYGWRIEAAMTNLILYSQTLSNAAWTTVNIGITENTVTGPDGVVSAAVLTPDTTSAGHSLYQPVSTDIGSVYCFSFYAKANGYNYLGLTLYDTAPVMAIFDLVNGSVATGTGTIRDMGNGWFRCSVIFTATKTTCYARIYTYATNAVSNYSGDGSSGIYGWGAQIEAASFPSSYVATTSAAVIRSADVWTIPLDTSWFRESAGTLFVSARTAGLGTQNLLRLDDGTSANTLYLYRHGTSRALVARAFADSADVLSATMDVLTDETAVRIALAWSDDGYWVALNGAIVASGTLSVPSGLATLRIGASVSGSAQWGGHIRHAAYFPTALSAAQLQALTL